MTNQTAAPASEADRAGNVRDAHRFDPAPLEAYLRAHVDGFAGELEVRQFQGGASNPTFLLTTHGAGQGRRYVLRKKPPGKLLASAHAVDREYRIMKALGSTDVPVPRMRVLCEDDGVIGTPFYVMDFQEGRIFRSAKLPGLEPAERSAIYDELNRVMTRLHAVDYQAVGLGDYGKPGNYFERQIGRWIKQYRGAQTDQLPTMEKLIDYLPQHIPADDTTCISHGDYRLENVMFHSTEPRIVAVLDWELSTLGHPLADLAYNCILYHSESEGFGSLKGVDFAATGIPSESEYVAAYCRRTGRDRIEDFGFYLGFSMFRLASISQGVYKRILDGNASSEAEAINGAERLAELAWEAIERG
ncbi:phosphotransferase [Zavarzinia sp. CC-PAN008]|uniref:phosphotransferase n=1 Tax=Zavarzinia sp. CC-PAN008 TaxID=3243332 RepID=UPI003F74A429